LIAPLRKCKPDGKLYTRRPEVEDKIIKLALLSRDELIIQCAIRQKDDPGYVPSECLMYFVRECRTNRPDIYFQKLYELLVERVLRGLPIAENGDTVSLTNSNIRDKVFGNFVQMLAGDRIVYSDKLDYYEINFNHALQSQRSDAQKQAWRNENRSTTLYDEETGDLIAAVEQAAGSFNTADASNKDCRIDLDEAINTLELIEREIIKMYVEGVPFDSQDPDKSTMVKKLGKSDKTIRTRFKKAIDALRVALNGGNQI
jgi:hypothetical protein